MWSLTGGEKCLKRLLGGGDNEKKLKHWEWQPLKVFKGVTFSEIYMYIFRHVNRRVEVAEV